MSLFHSTYIVGRMYINQLHITIRYAFFLSQVIFNNSLNIFVDNAPNSILNTLFIDIINTLCPVSINIAYCLSVGWCALGGSLNTLCPNFFLL